MKKVIFILMILFVDGSILAQFNLEDNIFDYKSVKTSQLKSCAKYFVHTLQHHILVDTFYFDNKSDKAFWIEYSGNRPKIKKIYLRGNLIEDIDYNVGHRKTYKYNQKDQVIEELTYSEGYNSPDFKTTYMYKNNRQVEKRTNTLSGGMDRETYKWGSDGSWMEVRSIDPNNGEKEITTYKYDKNNNLISRIYEVPNRPIRNREELYKYDISNKIIWKYYNKSSFFYQYNEKEKLIKTIQYHGRTEDQTNMSDDNQTSTTLFEYDDKGNLLKESSIRANYYDNGHLTSDTEPEIVTYSYDNHNNLIEKNENGNKYIFIYEWYK